MNNPICFALDVNSEDEAKRYIDILSLHVGAFKVGLELFMAAGPAILKHARKPVVLDLKLHDIPETVERAVKVGGDLGVKYMTLHVQQRATLERVAKLQEKFDLTLLGVTVLTSITKDDFKDLRLENGYFEDVRTRTLNLARYAVVDCGLRGLVCSPQEVDFLRMNFTKSEQPFLLVPGIRPVGAALGDQKRVGTPGQAIKDGANLLVIGRPIRDAADIRGAADAILKEIEETNVKP